HLARHAIPFFWFWQQFADALKQLLFAAVLHGAEGSYLAIAEPEEIGGVRFQLHRVALVGDADDGLAGAAQALGDHFVQRGDAVAGIDQKQNDGRLVNGEFDLLFHVGGEIVHVHDADAAGVDQFEPARAKLNGRADAIARDTGGRVDDGDAPPGEPV